MKNKKIIIIAAVISILFAVLIWFGSAALISFFATHKNKEEFNISVLISYLLSVKVITFAVFAFILCFVLFVIKANKKPKQGASAKRSKSNLHDDADFLTEEELIKNYGNKETNDYKRFSNINNEEVDGMVINSFAKKGDILFNAAESLNSCIVGSTGVGKSKHLLIPTVELMARSKNKPSMVLLDVKGEIYEKTNKNLKDQGYETHLVDLRNPSKSEKFNPFSLVVYYWDLYLQDANNIVAKEKAIDLILQICSMFNPKMKAINGGGQGDAYWDNAAMEVMEAYIWSLLENYKSIKYDHHTPFVYKDVNDNLTNGSAHEKAELKRIALSITGFGTKSGISFKAMQDIANLSLSDYYKYFYNRSSESQTYKTAHETIVNMIKYNHGSYEMERPLLSLLSVYKTNYKRVITETIESISSGNSFDLKEMYSREGKPFALYILMPDEDKSKYPFASLMISEIYQFFTSLSQEQGFNSHSKRRTVHFFMDEFANLNPMENIDNWLSVGRERRLFIHIFIQGLSQLNNKYGVEKARTILGNCNMKIFFALSENEVIDYAVKLFGSYTVDQRSTSASVSDRNSSNSYSTSLGRANLINPSEIKKLPKGHIYFMEILKNPGKGKLLATFDKPYKEAFNYD